MIRFLPGNPSNHAETKHKSTANYRETIMKPPWKTIVGPLS
jgi:hypothetical protein